MPWGKKAGNSFVAWPSSTSVRLASSIHSRDPDGDNGRLLLLDGICVTRSGVGTVSIAPRNSERTRARPLARHQSILCSQGQLLQALGVVRPCRSVRSTAKTAKFEMFDAE